MLLASATRLLPQRDPATEELTLSNRLELGMRTPRARQPVEVVVPAMERLSGEDGRRNRPISSCQRGRDGGDANAPQGPAMTVSPCGWAGRRPAAEADIRPRCPAFRMKRRASAPRRPVDRRRGGHGLPRCSTRSPPAASSSPKARHARRNRHQRPDPRLAGPVPSPASSFPISTG